MHHFSDEHRGENLDAEARSVPCDVIIPHFTTAGIGFRRHPASVRFAPCAVQGLPLSHRSSGTPPRPKEQLGLRERLFLPTWEKFKYYGIFPWKILLNVLLVALVTAQVSQRRVWGGEPISARSPTPSAAGDRAEHAGQLVVPGV